MKIIIVLFSIAVFVSAESLDGVCDSGSVDKNDKKFPEGWKDMKNSCIKAMENQIRNEFNASMTYLCLGAHFSQDTVNRPGFAKFFFDSANEEREHGIKLISYLLNRGELTSGINVNIVQLENFTQPIVSSGQDALTQALILEEKVTESIKGVIKICELDKSTNFNDYELVDYLTGEFLTEQYKGQRDLAGKMSTLQKMIKKHNVFGEYLFDKTLQ